MRLTGKEYIEIAHDALAAKVYDKASPLERQRLEAERVVREAYAQYRERGKMLDRSDFRLIQPVMDRLDLNVEEWAYLKKSRNRLRARQGLIIGTAGMLLLLGGFLWVAQSQRAVQQRLAEANRWVYLADHYAQNNQLDSALIYAGAAYDQTKPNPLPAAQRVLANAFHKGLEGIPLRQERHPLSGIFGEYTLLVDQQQLLLTYEDGRLALFDLRAGDEKTIYQGTYLTDFALHPEGGQALVADEDTVLTFDLRTGDEKDRFQVRGPLVGQGFWPAGGGTLTVTEDSLYFRDQDNPDRHWRRPAPTAESFLTSLALSPSASYAAVLTGNDSVYRISPEGEVLGAMATQGEVLGLGILREENLFLLTDSSAFFLDAAGRPLNQVPLPKPPDNAYGPQVAVDDLSDRPNVFLSLGKALVKLPHDGSRLDTVSTYERLYTDLRYAPERLAGIDLRTQHLVSLEAPITRRLMTLPAFNGMDYEENTGSLVMLNDSSLTWWQFTFGPYQERKAVESMFLPTPQSADLLAVEDGVVYRKSEAAKEDWEVLEFPEPITYAAVHPTNRSIMAVSKDGSLYQWIQDSIREIFQLSSTHRWHALRYENENLVVFKEGEAEIHFWDAVEGDFDSLAYDGVLHDVDFSPVSDHVAMAGSNDDVVLWKRNGDTLAHFKGHGRDVLDVSFSPDGTLVATASGDHAARLWDLQGQMIHEFLGHGDFVNAILFSPDGKQLLTASSDGTLKSWSAETGALLYSFLGHEGPVRGATFAPDQKSILSWSSDGTARLWDLQGEPLAVFGFPERQDPITEASFSPDGSRVITFSEDERLRIWLIPAEVNRWVRANYRINDP